jgi:putative transposase
MEQQTVCKTFKDRLKPTPQQEQDIERVLPLLSPSLQRRHRYNAAIGERSEAWRRRGVCVTSSQRQTALPGSKEAMPEYGAVHAQVLQDGVVRVDHTFQAFFRRLRAGQTPGSPRYHGRDRSNGLTYPQLGEHGGARLGNGFLALSKIGRSGVRWSRPLEGPPKTVTISCEADGWSVAISCADTSAQPLPLTGQETGIDHGIEALATLSDGTRIFSAGWYRQAERSLKMAQRRVSHRKKGSNRRRKVVLAKAHETVRRQRQDFHHKTALALVRQYDAIAHENLRPATMVRNHHLARSISDTG